MGDECNLYDLRPNDYTYIVYPIIFLYIIIITLQKCKQYPKFIIYNPKTYRIRGVLFISLLSKRVTHKQFFLLNFLVISKGA